MACYGISRLDQQIARLGGAAALAADQEPLRVMIPLFHIEDRGQKPVEKARPEVPDWDVDAIGGD